MGKLAAIETCMADSSKDEAHPLLEARSPKIQGLVSSPYVGQKSAPHQLWARTPAVMQCGMCKCCWKGAR